MMIRRRTSGFCALRFDDIAREADANGCELASWCSAAKKWRMSVHNGRTLFSVVAETAYSRPCWPRAPPHGECSGLHGLLQVKESRNPATYVLIDCAVAAHNHRLSTRRRDCAPLSLCPQEDEFSSIYRDVIPRFFRSNLASVSH